MKNSLYESGDIILTEMDFEKDAVIDAQYTFNLMYARHWFNEIVRPLSESELKKLYEKIEKQIDERGQMVHFAVRNRNTQKLLGFLRFNWINWNNAVGSIVVAIGDPETNKNLERQIMTLACRYAFSELNLFRIEISLLSIESNLITASEDCGFTREVTLRDGAFLFGEYCDIYIYGILRPEWENLTEEVKNGYTR